MKGIILALAVALLPAAVTAEDLQKAVVAGGCFWCVEADFDKVPGVVATTSGYTGGSLVNPTYEQVSRTRTGHYEAVEVTFDADVVSYDALLDHFWRTIDPTDAGGQFCDRGASYRTAIFARGPGQAAAARASRDAAQASLGQEIVTPILEAQQFWPAEGYHQDYYARNPVRYRFYRTTCGRDARLRQVWGAEAGGS
jgi:peptide-methionine (S)-S-oxide reductase